MVLFGDVIRKAWYSTSSPPPVMAMRTTALLPSGSVFGLEPGCV